MYKQTLYQTSPTSLSSALEEGTMTGNVDIHPMLDTQDKFHHCKDRMLRCSSSKKNVKDE